MRNATSSPLTHAISLYVHIPFCQTKCPYCDFNTYAGIESLIPAYVAALRKEVELWGSMLGHPPVHTVFFGGGTPSYLPEGDVASLMDSMGRAFDVTAVTETTLEANPGDLTRPKLQAYMESGINRLSIGVQSFDDRLLGILGRRHSADEATAAFRMARDSGFENVSIDLMYGLPHQSVGDWERSLAQAEELMPDHISMYCLTLESGTPMDSWVESGRMPEPDPDRAADMYLMAQDCMEPLGYRHYEISNWAQPGKESKHNLTYWRNEPYLGVGPGAHSYLMGHRFSNVKSPREYVRKLTRTPANAISVSAVSARKYPGLPANLSGMPVVEMVEPIERQLEMAETMMMGLRLDTGVSFANFAERFGAALSQVYGDVIEDLQDDGLLEANDGAVRLTGRGRLMGNEVFSRFFTNSAAPASAPQPPVPSP